MRIATIQQYAVFTEYLTLLSFESFQIGLVREMFTPLQSTVNEATRGIRPACCPTSSGPNVQRYIFQSCYEFLKFVYSKTKEVKRPGQHSLLTMISFRNAVTRKGTDSKICK